MAGVKRADIQVFSAFPLAIFTTMHEALAVLVVLTHAGCRQEVSERLALDVHAAFPARLLTVEPFTPSACRPAYTVRRVVRGRIAP